MWTDNWGLHAKATVRLLSLYTESSDLAGSELPTVIVSVSQPATTPAR